MIAKTTPKSNDTDPPIRPSDVRMCVVHVCLRREIKDHPSRSAGNTLTMTPV